MIEQTREDRIRQIEAELRRLKGEGRTIRMGMTALATRRAVLRAQLEELKREGKARQS